MSKKFRRMIAAESIPMAQLEMQIESLAFQNILVEMMMDEKKKFTPDMINKRLAIHIDRISDEIYARYGATPKV